ncbi:MAG: hypothetical protein GY798_22345 [Hyphomicrobiales bacterium]|nr:hypothetical protein [Hyphomicrobiales bacterium]
MPRGSNPGERRGGRQKGTPNKAKANREAAIAVAGISPRDFLLNGLAHYHGIIVKEQRKGRKADMLKIKEAYAAGLEYAKGAAPYCHSRLASISSTSSTPKRAPSARDAWPTFCAGWTS